jgi:phosphoribosylformylglycinamidine synthase
VPSGWQDQGEHLYLLGTTRDELDGSAWAEAVHSHLGGLPPRVVLDDERTLASLLHAASVGGLLSGAVDLGEGGLAQALADGSLRFGVGARVWIDEIMSRDGVDATAALFSESQGRVLVSVPHEEDVKFRGLCEGRGYPVLRIGVTDVPGADAAIEVQGLFTQPLAELRSASRATLPERFGAVIESDAPEIAADAAAARFERSLQQPAGPGISE